MTAAARGPRAAGPVTLRDFLELACDSSSDGFRSYPRCLPCSTDDALQQQQQPPVPARLLAEADHILRRSPSRSPGPGALGRISSLSRSFSRRIKEGLWRRRDDDDLYFDDRDSCEFPSPLVSSCSASDSESESESSEADDVAIVDDEMACPPPSSECDKQASSSSSSSSTSSADHDCADGGAGPDGNKMQAVADGDPAVGRGGKLGMGMMMQDKQQLSPVSVLDFPFDDDDGDERSDAGTCSPSFQRCQPPPRTTTTKQAQVVLHKIRRYDGIAEAVDPVDLEARFTATSSDSGESVGASTHLATTSSCCTDTSSSSARHGEEHQSADRSPSSQEEEEEEPDEYRLLARLLHLHQEDTAAVDEVSQVLMLDFFAEGLDRLRSSAAAGRDNDKAVAAAAEWLRGAGPRWGIRDVMVSGKAALEDMERGRRWMRVDEEERDVGAAVEGSVMDGLVDELVAELVPRRPVIAVDACPV